MKQAIKWFVSIGLAAQAGMVCAAFIPGIGYQAESYYANPHPDAALVSFDWDAASNLFYSTRHPFWDLGFAVYRYDGAAAEILYQDTNSFSGSRVTAIGGMIYFNDGGNYDNWNYNYFRYNPAGAEAPTNLGIAADLWGLETRDGSDFWAAGGTDAAIYQSALDANGDLVNNPPVNLGIIGNASGPLAFDADGNLFYTEGYNTAGPTLYRWSAAEVAAALADPSGAPLQPDGHRWTLLAAGDGCTGIQADPDGHILSAATSFAAPSELHRLLVLNGLCIGYEVVARADERLDTVRLRDGAIYASTSEGVFAINAARTLRLIAQAGPGGALTLIGLNDQGQTLRLAAVTDSAPGWVVRGIDGNRLLAQAGDGGAAAIAQLDGAGHLAGYTVVADAIPGWIVRSLAGNLLLAQAGDGGASMVMELTDAEEPAGERLVLNPAPGQALLGLDLK